MFDFIGWGFCFSGVNTADSLRSDSFFPYMDLHSKFGDPVYQIWLRRSKHSRRYPCDCESKGLHDFDQFPRSYAKFFQLQGEKCKFHNPKIEDSPEEDPMVLGMNSESYQTNGHDGESYELNSREGSSSSGMSRKSLPATW
ncbi:hypothetical protein CEXT_603321 [Caerostris extrusa]|uniref:Uncharacterized protein n=1 Tax=Caerostris extrusa TaxID=172846 RepID=A0AAV4UQW5_CAEEX|nr:hypothetical protein CEXT_603321 [Caerostris extrusa]